MPSARAGLRLPALPDSLSGCDDPLRLPNAPLSRGDVERLWARDRAALARCGANLDALVSYYEDLARRLAAEEK